MQNAQLSTTVVGTQINPFDGLAEYRLKLARITLDSMVQFVGLLDADGNVLEINKVALDAIGIELKDVLGKPFWTTFWWQVSDEVVKTVEINVGRARHGEAVQWDTPLLGHPDSRVPIILDAIFRPVKDDAGKVVFIVAEGRDITTRKEQELEIERKNQELKELLLRVSELDELKTQFFANESHELRTPLALIIGPAERMLERDRRLSDAERIDAATVIARNGKMLLKHVNDLLDISKLEAGKLDVLLATTSVTELVRFIAGHFDVLAVERNVTLVVDTPVEIIGQVDQEKLQRMVMNLTSNAFKFTPVGGTIRCSVEAANHALRICIDDSGPGVQAEFRAVIFERFRQGEGGANRQIAGTGLGLAIVKEFAHLQGGTVKVTKSELGGAKFEIELPIASPLSETAQAGLAQRDAFVTTPSLQGVLEELREPARRLPTMPISPRKQRGRVLVVEHNVEMSRFILECLAQEFEVRTAFDGQAGFDAAMAAPPDLIVSDIMMPRVSGDQMVGMVRQQPTMADIPILLLSAKADEALVSQLLDNGAQDFVTKPFSERELLVRARNLVELKLTREDAIAVEKDKLRMAEDRAQQHAERSKQIGALFDQAPSFMAILRGPEHYIELANARMMDLVGGRPIIGNTIVEALPETVEQGFVEKLDYAFATGQANVFTAVPYDVPLAGGNGLARHYLNFVQQPILDADGKVTGIFVEGVDVTAAHEDHLALIASQAALRQAQKMEAVGQLTGGIAHDFNNLLASISGSLEVLKIHVDRGTTAGLEKYIKMGRDSVRRAASLTQRLLAFSRRQTLDPKPININNLVVGLEELIRRTVGPTVAVEVMCDAGLWITEADAAQLESSLINLCINARDSMLPDGGRLTIETANKWIDERTSKTYDLTPGQYVSICVTDTGTGMTPDVIERIFDPFFTTKPLGQGTGLGLSMVYGFVRQSSGQVKVYSEVGQGTTMCLYLPMHVGDAQSEEILTGEAAVDHGDGEVVLLIEDEETVRVLVSEVLQECGYRVITAADGSSGLLLLQSDVRIDLLISDVGLPGGLNGRQVADAGRVERPALKVLFITGYADNAAVGNGLLGPGMEVLTKPFEISVLATKVRYMLEH